MLICGARPCKTGKATGRNIAFDVYERNKIRSYKTKLKSQNFFLLFFFLSCAVDMVSWLSLIFIVNILLRIITGIPSRNNTWHHRINIT